MLDTIDNRLNKNFNQYCTFYVVTGGETRDRNIRNKQQINCQNSFKRLHSSVLSRDSGKPASILSSLIDQNYLNTRH